MPHVRGISEIKFFGNWYDIRTVFKTKHALRGSLMTTRPERNPQIVAHFICSILCARGENYFREIGWPLAMLLREHCHNLKERLLKKLKRAEYSDRGHRINRNESSILQVEINLLKPGACFTYQIVYNINNSAFHPQIAVLCFVWVSEQWAIISL
jgi:hypothetical protein